MLSGPGSRCVRSLGNRARPGDNDRTGGRREARTSAMKREGRAAAAAWARLSGPPLCKRWRGHLPVSYDRRSGVPRDVPFLGPGPAIATLRSKRASSAPVPRHLEDDLQLDRGAERKTGDAIYQAAGTLVCSEDILQQLRSGVGDFRLIADISRCRHRHAEPDDPGHFVQRSQMLPRDREHVERREASCLASRFDIELRTDAPDELRPVSFRGKHPAQKQEIACLHRFRIRTERLGRCRELDTKFLQPTFGESVVSTFVIVALLLKCAACWSVAHPNLNTKASTAGPPAPQRTRNVTAAWGRIHWTIVSSIPWHRWGDISRESDTKVSWRFVPPRHILTARPSPHYHALRDP